MAYGRETGKRFSTTAVNHMLRNEVYIGALVWRALQRAGRGDGGVGSTEDIIRVDGTHEALVSREDFERVQQQLTSRRSTSTHPRTVSSQ